MTEHKTIVNVETGEQIERPLTKAEKDEDAANLKLNKIAEEAKAKAEADKAALLARLGLTEDELKTILG